MKLRLLPALVLVGCGATPEPAERRPATAVGDGGAAVAAKEPPEKKRNSDGERLLLLDLHGALPERAPPLDFSEAPTLRKVLDRLVSARGDARIKTVVARIGHLSCGLAVASELREGLAELSAAGKRVVCHLDSGSEAELLVSTACAEVTISPAAELFAVGAHLEALFFKPLLDKVGVSADFEHVGRWKGAAEPLTRDRPSPELAATYQSIVDAADHEVTQAVATARHLTPAEVGKILDRAPLTAAEAVQAKLFDRVGYADELVAKESDHLEIYEPFKHDKSSKDFSILDLLSNKTKGHSSKPHVAIVPVVGPIVDGAADSPLAEEAAASELVRALDEARRSDAVKAVVLRISSPGGSALASDLIWRAVERTRARKPVYASMGAVAASGGYYVASAANKIYADPTTITGSIGVVGGKLVVSVLLDKLGIHVARFGSRAHSHALSSTSRFTPEERAAVLRAMTSTYDLFVDRVAAGRHMPREKVLAVAEGRVWVATEAKKHGLVDELGGLQATLQAARKAADLPADAPVETYPAAKGLFDFLSGGGGTEARLNAAVAANPELALLPPQLRQLLLALPSLSQDRVWALLAVSFTL